MFNLQVLNITILIINLNLQAAHFAARFGDQWNSSIDNMDLWDDIQFNDRIWDLCRIGPVLCRVALWNPGLPIDVVTALVV